MTPYIIGIDIGTGSTKAIAIDTAGNVLHSVRNSYPTLQPKPGYSEQIPHLIWEAFVTCLRETITHFGYPPMCISLSSAMHSLLAVDVKGNPVMNMITWADNRSATIAGEIKKSPLGEAIYKQTGTPIHAMSPLCKIVWLKENEPTLFFQAHKFLSIKEFIWFKIFGVFEIDHSLASATGLFNIITRTWDADALTLASISASHLSQPVRTGYQRKDYGHNFAQQSGLSKDVIFVIGASDGCAANLGSFATSPGAAALTIGTSGAIRVSNHKPTYNFQAMTFNYILDEDTFISGGPINNGGVALKWYVESFLQKKLTSAEDYDIIVREIETIDAGSNGLIFLPYLLGERAPVWNSEAYGVFFGITVQHTQAHFTRAVIEGISMALYHVASALEESELNIAYLMVSGGFTNSLAWVQILTDIFNKNVYLTNPEDASAFGAAYIAMKSLGIITTYSELKPKSAKMYTPNATHYALYQKMFSRYKRLSKLMESEM